jgi:hypothetical protein
MLHSLRGIRRTSSLNQYVPPSSANRGMSCLGLLAWAIPVPWRFCVPFLAVALTSGWRCGIVSVQLAYDRPQSFYLWIRIRHPLRLRPPTPTPTQTCLDAGMSPVGHRSPTRHAIKRSRSRDLISHGFPDEPREMSSSDFREWASRWASDPLMEAMTRFMLPRVCVGHVPTPQECWNGS